MFFSFLVWSSVPKALALGGRARQMRSICIVPEDPPTQRRHWASFLRWRIFFYCRKNGFKLRKVLLAFISQGLSGCKTIRRIVLLTPSSEDPPPKQNDLDNFQLISQTFVKSRLSRLYFMLDSYLTVKKMNLRATKNRAFALFRLSKKSKKVWAFSTVWNTAHNSWAVLLCSNNKLNI